MKYKHNIYRNSVNILNYYIVFDSKKNMFQLSDTKLNLNDIYLRKGDVHRFHQTHSSNFQTPIILIPSNSDIKVRYVYKNQLVTSEKYSSLISTHVPNSCFVDFYLDSRCNTKTGNVIGIVEYSENGVLVQQRTGMEIG